MTELTLRRLTPHDPAPSRRAVFPVTVAIVLATVSICVVPVLAQAVSPNLQIAEIRNGAHIVTGAGTIEAEMMASNSPHRRSTRQLEDSPYACARSSLGSWRSIRCPRSQQGRFNGHSVPARIRCDNAQVPGKNYGARCNWKFAGRADRCVWRSTLTTWRHSAPCLW
jgi:hypothetical protein